MSKYPDLTGFKALSFDCYGTLIDWESGLRSGLEPILSQLPASHPFAQNPMLLMQRFDDLTDVLEKEQPRLLYDQNLAASFRALSKELDVSVPESTAADFGDLPGTWGAFPDTVAGLEILKKHYKLIILSNINNANIEGTVSKQLAPVEFDAVYTAEEIGSYKPAHKNFNYLFKHAKEELGIDVDQGELLHVARSLPADHVPAKEMGFRSCWIARGGDSKEGKGVGGDYESLADKVAFEWKFDTIGDFAEEVKRQFAAKA